MKHLLTTLSLGALLLMGGPTTVQAEKVTVPLTEDGAWSFKSQLILPGLVQVKH